MSDVDTGTTADGGASMNEPSPEDRARRMGWRPEGEYKGDKPWIDAGAFLERAESAPVLKSKLNKAQGEIEHLKVQVKEVQSAAQEFRKLASAEAERKWQEKYDTLVAAQAKAVEQADGEAFQAAQADLQEHTSKKPASTTSDAKAGGPQDPIVQAWVAENPWYNQYPDMAAAAARAGQKAYNKGLRGQEVLDAMRDYVVDKYPEEFDEAPTPTRSSGHGPSPARGGRTGGSSRTVAKTYENLPADAKKACDQLIRAKMVKDAKQYCEMFDWSSV